MHDNVDPAYTRRPHRWDIRIIRDFMLLIGPLSSIRAGLRYFLLLRLQLKPGRFHIPFIQLPPGYLIQLT